MRDVAGSASICVGVVVEDVRHATWRAYVESGADAGSQTEQVVERIPSETKILKLRQRMNFDSQVVGEVEGVERVPVGQF